MGNWICCILASSSSGEIIVGVMKNKRGVIKIYASTSFGNSWSLVKKNWGGGGLV